MIQIKRNYFIIILYVRCGRLTLETIVTLVTILTIATFARTGTDVLLILRQILRTVMIHNRRTPKLIYAIIPGSRFLIFKTNMSTCNCVRRSLTSWKQDLYEDRRGWITCLESQNKTRIKTCYRTRTFNSNLIHMSRKFLTARVFQNSSQITCNRGYWL